MRIILAVLMMVMTSVVFAEDMPDSATIADNDSINGSLNSNNNNTTNDSSQTNVVGDTYSGQSVSHNQTNVMNTPSAIAPVITTGYDTCAVAVSGGASAPGFGLSFGKNNRDKTCELLKLTKQLQSMGLSDGAVAMMLQDDRVADAIFVAYPELYDRLKPVKRPRSKKKRK